MKGVMMKRKFLIFTMAVCCTLAFSQVVEAKSRSFGGGRSFSRPSTPKSTTTKSWGSKATKPKSNAGWGQKKSSTAKAPSKKLTTSRNTSKLSSKKNSADRKLASKAKKNGTYYTDKSKATADFKTKHKAQYKSTYASKPATRPSHIPQSTMVGGTSVNINYNQGYGGYGYTNALGVWIMYDMMSDAIMMDRMMAHRGYVVDTRMHYTRNMSPWPGIIIAFLVVGGTIFLIAKLSK